MQSPAIGERKPTLEFDGDILITGDKVAPCAVQIWFAGNSYDPMTINVMAPGIKGIITQPIRIVSRPDLFCSAGCDIKLDGVLLRRWASHSTPPRRHLQHVVVLAEVRRIVVSRKKSPPGGIATGEGRTRERLVMKLSESAYLSPTSLARPDDKGVLKFEHRHHLKANHISLGTVHFERYYRFTPLQAEDVQVSSELVAVVGRPLRDKSNCVDAASTAEALEDFCLFASIATRHRIRVRGWKFESSDAFEDAFLNPLKPGAGLPKIDEHDVLIPREHASAFLCHCAKAWRSFTEDELRKLRHACYALAPISKPTIEGHFLAMFPALEGLVSIFRARQGGNLVYGEQKTWSHIRKKLSEAVDSIAVNDPQFNPSAIKRNLSALKRVPLEESTKIVLTELGAWNNALWPLFDNKSGSLANIRNLLAHGEQLDPNKIGAVVLANSHLQIVLERTFCCALGWPLDDTSVSDAAMLGQEREFAREIDTGRAVLSDACPPADTAAWMPAPL
jgi:hypothetical protein